MKKIGFLLALTWFVSIEALAAGTTLGPSAAPSPLLAIDQNRATVVDRIVTDWGDNL